VEPYVRGEYGIAKEAPVAEPEENGLVKSVEGLLADKQANRGTGEETDRGSERRAGEDGLSRRADQRQSAGGQKTWKTSRLRQGASSESVTDVGGSCSRTAGNIRLINSSACASPLRGALSMRSGTSSARQIRDF
jgi:hypothetical protein